MIRLLFADWCWHVMWHSIVMSKCYRDRCHCWARRGCQGVWVFQLPNEAMTSPSFENQLLLERIHQGRAVAVEPMCFIFIATLSTSICIKIKSFFSLTCKKLRASRWRHSRKWACLCSDIKWEMLRGIRTSRPSTAVRTSSGLQNVRR